MGHRHLYETMNDGTILSCACGASWAEVGKGQTLGQVAYEAWAEVRRTDGFGAKRWVDLMHTNQVAWERAAKTAVCEHVARCITEPQTFQHARHFALAPTAAPPPEPPEPRGGKEEK